VTKQPVMKCVQGKAMSGPEPD